MTKCNMTYLDGYKYLTEQLHSAFEADQLFTHVTGKKRYEIPLLKEQYLSVQTENKLKELVSKRLAGEPLQYLLGEWEFYGLPFVVGEGVLIPREDTEPLVNTALERLKDMDNPSVLDLCSGSGCVAIAIERFSTAQVTAVEISEKAFFYLEKNIELNNSQVHAVKEDLFQYQHSCFVDMIVSNPPYIPTKDLAELQVEVQKEPQLALDGGSDGLDFYRYIIKNYYMQLKDNGWMALEIGIHQENDVKQLFLQNGYDNISFVKDLGDLVRVVVGQKIPEK